MNTNSLKVFFFPSNFLSHNGVLILSKNKQEAIVHIKKLSNFHTKFNISKSEIIKDFNIHSINVELKNDYYHILDISFDLNKDDKIKYYKVEKYCYAQEQEKTEKELFKLFLENLKTKEFRYEW